MKKDMPYYIKEKPTQFCGGYREEKHVFLNPLKLPKSININDYKLEVGELKTEEDLEHYISELNYVRDNKHYYLHSAIRMWPQQLIFSFIAYVFSRGAAQLFTDKAWPHVFGAIVGTITFVATELTYENAADYHDAYDCTKKIRFLKKAIRKYESAKAQQSNAMNNVAGNVK